MLTFFCSSICDIKTDGPCSVSKPVQMEACVNNNKAKPQQLELAFPTLRVDYANQHRKDAESGISHYIYIYVLIDLIFYLKAAMKNMYTSKIR